MNHLYKKLVWVLILLIVMVGCSSETPATEEVVEEEITKEEVVEEIVEEVVEEAEEIIEEPEPKIVTPEFGGTLRIAMSPADTLDPIENRVSNVAQVLGMVFDPLFTIDKQLLPQAVLVDSYEFDITGKSLTITLKENVLFHNGGLLTTDDVAYTIDKIKDSKNSPFREIISPIKRYSILDQRVMTLYFDEGHAFILQDLNFPILSAAYEKSEDYNHMKPIGTGPYVVTDYQHMQQLDLISNATWHGGSVYIEKIIAIVMNETDSLENLFDQNIIDIMTPSKFNWLKYSDKEDQRIESYMSTYYDFLGFNFENKWLQDVDFRKAIAHSLDRESMIYNSFINHGVIVDAPIIPGSWFATESEIVYNYDEDYAKNLINPIVYKDVDGDGFYDQPDIIDDTLFETIELIMLVNEQAPHRVAIAPQVEASIENLGFSVTTEVVDPQTYYDRITNKNFDIVLGGWKLSSKPDYTSLFASDGSQNYFGYQSESMDQLLMTINSTYDQSLMTELIVGFEELMISEMPYVSLYFLEGAVMSRGNVYGELKPSTYQMLNEIERLYLDLEVE